MKNNKKVDMAYLELLKVIENFNEDNMEMEEDNAEWWDEFVKKYNSWTIEQRVEHLWAGLKQSDNLE